MTLPAKILLLLLLNYVDGLATLHFVIEYGEEVEQNPLMIYFFNRFGVEIVILIKIIGMTILGIAILPSCVENTKMRIAHIIANMTIGIYILICLVHFINLTLH